MRKFLFFFLILFISIILSLEKEIENKTQSNIEKNSTDKNESPKENITLNEPSNKANNNSFVKSQNKTLNKTKNGKSKNNKKPKNKVSSPPINISSLSPDDYKNATNKEVYLLNDLTFDMILQNGNNYKWLVILYSETCGHCEHARRELRKIFPKYRYSKTIKFAEIEINRNPMTSMRFEIEGVPYIFLLQNNSIYEMDLYPNQKNYQIFIETDFKNLTAEDLKPFPPMVPLYKFGWLFLQNIFNGITTGVNEMLYDMGYEFEFTPLSLFVTIITFFTFLCFLECFCCYKFCPDDDKKEIKNKKENKDEKNDKKEDEDKEEDKSKKAINEEERIKREKEKEKKNKEKESNLRKEKEKKDNTDNKETKYKKKEKKKKE